MSFRKLLRQPAAWVPLCMSFLALATVMVHVIRSGAAREADEGAAAHIWQLLMAVQLPVIGFFAIQWLPGNRRPALLVLALQIAAVLAALAPVFFLNL